MSERKDLELPAPTDAVSSVAFHPTNPSLLSTSSWSSHATVFNLSSPTSPVQDFVHPAPVLDSSFGLGDSLFSGCLDHGVRELDVASGVMRVIGTHSAAVRCVHYSPHVDALITGSWDKSVSVLDPRSSPSSTTRSLSVAGLPGKVFALDAEKEKVVVAMGARKVWIYDLRMMVDAVRKDEVDKEVKPWQERESSLKFMTRAVKCMPNGQGYASTSIEGRVAVEFFDPAPEAQAKKYAFKCHRQTIDGVDTVFSVNALSFHPEYGTFATGGGDSIVSIWDAQAKKRLRQLPRFAGSVASLAFNSDGSKMAVGCGVFEEEGNSAAKGGRNAVTVRNVGEDCKPKAK